MRSHIHTNKKKSFNKNKTIIGVNIDAQNDIRAVPITEEVL